MIRTFVDAGVLIAAARAQGRSSASALDLIDDPSREFVSSIFLQLEILPKATFYKRDSERRFYEAFFRAVRHWAPPRDVCDLALEIATESGLAALDALHVAAAVTTGAEQLVTTELPTKPLYRTRRLAVIAI